MPDIPANNAILTRILGRLDQFDQKFTGELQSVHDEVQTVRNEVQTVRARVDEFDQKFTSEIQSVSGEVRFVGKELQVFHQASLETWAHLRRALEQSEQRAIAREELHRKDAIIQDMQQRLAKLEIAQNPAN
jgi:hypothetical protein